MRSRVVLAAAFAIVVAAAAFGIVLSSRAPDPATVPTVQEVYDRTMSPYCPGLTLTECPAQRSAELRAEVAELVARGRTNEEIDSALVAAYGPSVLGSPQDPLSWGIPLAALVLGAAALIAGLARKRRPVPEQPDEAPATTEERERLDKELEGFAGGKR